MLFLNPQDFLIWITYPTTCVRKKVSCLINNRTKAFRSIFKISFVSDKCDINLDFDTSVLKIRQILTELQELQTQNAVNHETNELYHFGSYVAVHVGVESIIYMLHWCQDCFFIFFSVDL